MEDKGLGNIIFYIILAVIGIIGSFKSKQGKKVTAGRKPEAMTVPEPPPVVVIRQPEPVFAEPVDEGNFLDPVAELFSEEGNYANPAAESFSEEGSIESSMAIAFASEGIRGMTELQMKAAIDSTISDSEIGDAPVYDYNTSDGEEVLAGGFNIHKAVIYSALLNRKEYTF